MNEDRREYWKKVAGYQQDVDEECRLLEGNRNRLCVTDNVEEAYRQYYFITLRASRLLKITLRRIAECGKEEE